MQIIEYDTSLIQVNKPVDQVEMNKFDGSMQIYMN